MLSLLTTLCIPVCLYAVAVFHFAVDYVELSLALAKLEFQNSTPNGQSKIQAKLNLWQPSSYIEKVTLFS